MNKRKKIKPFSEIAPWYERTKYEPAGFLPISSWYQLLLVRKIINLSFNSTLKNVISPIREAIQFIRSKPIFNIFEDEPLFIFLPFTYFSNPIYAQGVHPLTVREFCSLEKKIPAIKLKHTKNWLNQNHILKNIPYHPWIDEPLNRLIREKTDLSDVVSVNYNLPLPLLMKQFEEHIKTKKSSINNINYVYRKPDFDEWYRLGVLPYMDLKLWEQESNIKITNNQMARAIYFADDAGGEDGVRRTTKPLADKLLSDTFLEELAAQAMLENVF